MEQFTPSKRSWNIDGIWTSNCTVTTQMEDTIQREYTFHNGCATPLSLVELMMGEGGRCGKSI